MNILPQAMPLWVKRLDGESAAALAAALACAALLFALRELPLLKGEAALCLPHFCLRPAVIS